MTEHVRDLARALRAGNLAAATMALDLLARDRFNERDREAIARGRADADKAAGRTTPLPSVGQLTLPRPGAGPNAVLGDDPRERIRKRAA